MVVVAVRGAFLALALSSPSHLAGGVLLELLLFFRGDGGGGDPLVGQVVAREPLNHGEKI